MKATGERWASDNTAEAASFDARSLREDFPILKETVHGKPLVYLDSAATSQKPRAVIDATAHYYSADNSNIHRGVHLLSERATREYEAARVKAQQFINAPQSQEIIFVRGTTEAINLVANSYGREHVREGDEVLITTMEHHSNIVPWQLLCDDKGARLKVVPINDDGEVIWEEFEKSLNERTRILSVAHVSNALGTINPVRRMIEHAHSLGVPVLLDGATESIRVLSLSDFSNSSHMTSPSSLIGTTLSLAPLSSPARAPR